uniref:Uncharacterized protein n=1 Tax=Mantoniella antarctica TaxID=81844 RepID=A0A7S0STI9_9CHLO
MASRVSCCTPCGVSSAGASGRLARSVAYRQLPSPLPCGRRRSGLERKGVGGGSRPRRDDTVRRDAAEMMGVAVYADDLLEACAPWGNVCVVAGTHYIPIALPSILGSVFLLAPLVAVAFKLQQSSTDVTRKEMRIRELEAELLELKK